jgi:hypothetical protein
LLLEAHALNPNSAFRDHTLYSTVFGIVEENGVPDSQTAELYAREFPSAPFIVHVYVALAHFHDDLYNLIQAEEAGQRIDYKYDCYQEYLTDAPLAEQRRVAQEAGVRNYERLLTLLPQNTDEREYLDELRSGQRLQRWFYCGD